MFSYCNNSPCNHNDPTGLRLVGYGFQADFRTGDISRGAEVIIYTDPQVCGGEDRLVTIYTYSGYDLSVGNMETVNNVVEALVTTAVFETNNSDVYAWYSAVTTVLNGAGVSGGAFVIDGNKQFKSPEDYSGSFETQSLTGEIKGVSVTGFYSYSPTCKAYGMKAGVGFDGIAPSSKRPFDITYSRSFYSKPYYLEF